MHVQDCVSTCVCMCMCWACCAHVIVMGVDVLYVEVDV